MNQVRQNRTHNPRTFPFSPNTAQMVSKKKTTATTTAGDGGVAEYEQSREQRIKENLLRMQKLGIMELSRNLKPVSKPKPKAVRPQKPVVTSADEPRRSSRIMTIPTVSYSERPIPKEKVKKDVKIVIKDGSKLEVYTEEHEKMLGDHKEHWIVGVDGYDDEGNRMYDAHDGKSCHQCRQKTLGLRTKCLKCKTVQGQFCGDCLFQRYGENVEEANANPDWVCPVCRDICNCSRCRRVKGWEPTGNIYRKAKHLGYKSVAHYLIHTRGPNGKQEDIEDLPTDEEGDPMDDKDDNINDGKQLDDKDDDNMDEDGKHVPVEKSIKPHDRKKKSKGDDDDADSDYKSDSQDDDDDNDDEDQSSEED